MTPYYITPLQYIYRENPTAVSFALLYSYIPYPGSLYVNWNHTRYYMKKMVYASSERTWHNDTSILFMILPWSWRLQILCSPYMCAPPPGVVVPEVCTNYPRKLLCFARTKKLYELHSWIWPIQIELKPKSGQIFYNWRTWHKINSYQFSNLIQDAKHLSLQNHGHGRQRTRPVTSKSVRRTRTHCMIIFSERFSFISSSDLQRIYSFIL